MGTDKDNIDWADVKAFFDRAIYKSPELKVLVTMDDREMEVRIPPHLVRKFMENLPTYSAVVLEVSKVYTSEEAVKDLEKIIAQETSGVSGAIPEQDDQELARAFVQIINSDARHELGFYRRLSDIK